MSISTEKAEKHLDNIEEFLRHNMQLGFINQQTTVEELLKFTRNIKEQYIPMIKHIESMPINL